MTANHAESVRQKPDVLFAVHRSSAWLSVGDGVGVMPKLEQ
jgi:hypothetical protein